MNTCGSNRWWIDDTKLILRRTRGLKEWVKGLGALALSGAAFAVLHRFGFSVEATLEVGIPALAGSVYGLYATLGTWEVELQRVTGRVSWRWGLGLPLWRRTRKLTPDALVTLSTQQQPRKPGHIKDCTVELTGLWGTHILAGSDDQSEALALAEAVARVGRVGLQVDGGRVRPFEAWPGQRGPESAKAVPPLPPGSGVQVREEAGQRVVDLPPAGWSVQHRRTAVVGGLVLLGAVGVSGFLHGALEPEAFWRVLFFNGCAGVLGLSLLWRGWWGARMSWRLRASRRGLEVERSGWGGPSRTTRVPAHQLKDIDVREVMAAYKPLEASVVATQPLLIIDREEQDSLELGRGLGREELEWAAAQVREALAEPRRTQEGTAEANRPPVGRVRGQG